MRRSTLAARLAVLAAAPIVAFVGMPGQAAAAEFQFTDVQTLANGAWVCGGTIRTWATTSPDWPDRAILNMRATQFTGIAGLSSWTPVCNVDATVDWRNLDTGAVGQWRVNVVAGMYGSIQYSLFQPTGPGRITATVTTNAPRLGDGKGEFRVP